MRGKLACPKGSVTVLETGTQTTNFLQLFKNTILFPTHVDFDGVWKDNLLGNTFVFQSLAENYTALHMAIHLQELRCPH